MQTNPFFQKFATKHEKAIEIAVEKLDSKLGMNDNLKNQLMAFIQ